MIPQILPKKVRLDPQGNVNFFHARFVWNMSTFFLKVKVLKDFFDGLFVGAVSTNSGR
jgi:hypothetical protein